jgi:hypothetical protein
MQLLRVNGHAIDMPRPSQNRREGIGLPLA